MTEPFAKLFDTPTGQILIMRDYDPVRNKYFILIRNGEGMELHVGGWRYDKTKSLEALAAASQQEAEAFALSMANTTTGVSSMIIKTPLLTRIEELEQKVELLMVFVNTQSQINQRFVTLLSQPEEKATGLILPDRLNS